MTYQPKTQIGRYEIISVLGKGGMGEVYLAEDTDLDRNVAIKFLSEDFSQDSDKLNRFIQEAKAASALNHPNIITIYEIGEFENTHFIAAELIEGETLAEKLRNESIELDTILDISIQIASALDEAHEAGIVHRDIKPDNIMIRSNGLVKILDFGIAKLTEDGRGDTGTRGAGEDDETLISQTPKTMPGMIIGTANYMSPEQAKGKVVDARTDIFSFGVVLYEMVAGCLPFEGETAMEMIGAIIHKEPKLLKDVHPELEEIINTTLKKNRNERYQNSKELLEDLQNLKKRIEFEAELERTSSLDKNSEAKTQIFKADTTEETAIHTASNRNSIAVMPFEHLSSDEDNEYFCDGLAEELINALAKVERLEVAARSSSFSFKDKNANISEVGETLNVRNILEGSVRKAGNRLRISVQLVNATDGYQIWSERYDREMEDIFDIQDEIALAVVEALKVKLLGGEKEAVLKKYTSNAEAYHFYLQGRFFFSKRTPEGFDKAIEYYKQAIEIDSEYALAYSGLVDCYVILGFYELLPTEEAERLSVPLAQKAMQIDNTIAEVWVSSALSKFFGDLSEGDAHYQKAISLNPKYASAYHFRATTLMLLGQHQEAIEASKRAIELEPFAVSFNGVLAWWYYLSGLNDEAIEQSLKTIEIAPSHYVAYWVLGIAYGKERDFTNSISNLQKAVELSNNVPHVIAELGRIYAEAGKLGEAKRLLDELRQRSKNEYVSPVNFVKFYIGFGKRQKVLEHFEKASEKNAFRLSYLLIDPLFDDYRSEPIVQETLRRLHMPTDEDAKNTNEKLEAETILVEQKTKDEEKNRTTVLKRISKRSKDTTKRDWQIAGIISLLIVVFGILGYYLTADSSNQIESIAVMPFVNESGNEDVEYLSDGMTETLISSLSQLPEVSVKARNSVFRYKGKEFTPKKVGEELGVQAVLLGTVVKRGEEVSLNLELVDAETENVLWSNKYNRKMTNLVSLQSEIARNVSENIKLKLNKEETLKVSKKYTANNEAYQAYLKGRFYFNKRGNRQEKLEKAKEFYLEAIELDPNYALAYVGLADTYADLSQYPSVSSSDAMSKGKAAAKKATELDPNLGEAHAALAQIMFGYDWDFAGAEKEYKEAIRLNPNYAKTHDGYGFLLALLGRYEEAIVEGRKAVELEPLSPGINFNYGYFLFAGGKLDEAVKQFRKIQEMYPEFTAVHINLGFALARQKKYDEAIAEINKTKPGTLISKDVAMGIVYAVSGDKTKAKTYLKKELVKPTKSRSGLALLYATLNEKDKAFELLEKAYRNRDVNVLFIKSPWYSKNLGDDPRYKDLLKRIGFPE